MGTNNDILLKGLDGASTITALQLDMSENGNAIFSGNITATDITANSLTTNVISSNGSNADISIQPSGTGDVLLGAIRVNGTTLDSSDSTLPSRWQSGDGGSGGATARFPRGFLLRPGVQALWCHPPNWTQPFPAGPDANVEA